MLAYYNLGNLLADLGRKDEAEEQYRLAIKADPNLAGAHNNYANLLRNEGRFSEAEKEVRIALDIDPLDPNYLGTLGDILADEGWLDESEKEYKFALEHSDKMDDSAKSEIHNNLGWVYAKKELFANAKDEFFKARTIDPRNIKAIRNLRAVERIETPSEITKEQKWISGLLVLPLSLSIYLFCWTEKLNETSFAALFMFFTATILFVLLYRSMGRFSVGPKGVEFEMSTEHRLAPAQAQVAESISKLSAVRLPVKLRIKCPNCCKQERFPSPPSRSGSPATIPAKFLSAFFFLIAASLTISSLFISLLLKLHALPAASPHAPI